MSRRPRNASHDNASTTSSLGSYSRSRSPGSRTSSTRRIAPPPLERAQSIKDKTAHFFGIPSGEGNDTANLSTNTKWQRKRLRHLQKEYGLKPEAIQSVAAAVTPVVEYDTLGDIVNNLPPADSTPSSSLPRSDSDGSRIYSRILSLEPPQMERKESVMKMAVEACESIVRGDPFRRSKKFPSNRSPGNSFSLRRNQSTLTANSSFPIRPAIIMQALPEVSTDAETSFSEPSRDPDRPFVGTPVQSDEEIPDFNNRSRFGIRPEGRQQAFVFPGRRQQVAATRGRSRSTPLVHQIKVEESEDEQSSRPREESRVKFADIDAREMDDERSDNEQSTSGTTSTSALRPKDLQLMPFLNKSQQQESSRRGVQFIEPASTSSRRRTGMDSGETIPLQAMHNQQVVDEEDELFFDSLQPRPKFAIGSDGEAPSEPSVTSMRVMQPQPAAAPSATTPLRLREILKKKEENIEVPATRTFFQRLRRSFRNSFPSHSVKSLTSILITGNEKKKRDRNLPFGGSFKKRQDGIDPILKRQLDNEFYDDRPYFTYYITVIQIIIMIAALFRYGFGTSFTTNYFGVTEKSGDVITATLSNVHIVVWEQNNIWIGPRYADLVHMGAKYSPCMRRDLKIMEQIEEERRIESEETGCCVSSEGCYQTSVCAKQFSRFIKTTTDSKGFTTRAVCGQDPRYCRNPESVAPHRWNNKDISKWPICKEVSTRIPSSESHMKCEIRGRPCCIQMHGQCRITTKEYCDFVKGHYHENATLCSQVSCLGDICGMTPFLRRDHPDQFYRFFTPLFIHAGILPMLITIWVQFNYMRRFEILIGWTRTSIIYFASGIGGYLASAVFVPYMPQVGPIPSQSGILGAMVVNVIYNWSEIKKPHCALLCHLAVALFLFVCGFLPFIDNFAQVFGFFFGALLACALIPYIGADEDPKLPIKRREYYVHIRILIVAISLLGTIGLFFLLFLLFAVVDPSKLPDISLMSCIFKGERLCDQQSLTLKDWLPI